MSANKCYVFVPGILGQIGTGWEYAAADFIRANQLGSAMMLDYQDGIFRWHQRANTTRLLQMVAGVEKSNASTHTVLVGHSNGTALICDALQRGMVCDEVWLLSSCASVFCARNGLNEALLQTRVDAVHVLITPDDEVLPVNWGGWLLGYGMLGLYGPRDADPRIKTWTHTGYRHSTPVYEEFRATMREITGV